MNVNTPSFNLNPKNPVLISPLSTQLNYIPLSLPSLIYSLIIPIFIIGSTTLIISYCYSKTSPWMIKFPVNTKSPYIVPYGNVKDYYPIFILLLVILISSYCIFPYTSKVTSGVVVPIPNR